MLRLILKKLTFKEENRIAGGKIRKKNLPEVCWQAF